jgi:dihydroorotase/N-acyl-D-amino-acid deacylase
MRSEADRLLEAIDEAMKIGREGGIPVEIFHLKAAGVRNWPKAADAVAKIEYARSAGLDIAADMYPYVAGGTGLAACTPPWATANDKLLDNLRDSTTRRRILAEMNEERTSWENLCSLATPSGVMVVGFRQDSLKKYEGRRLGEDGGPGMLVFLMSEENVAMQLRQPWMKIGTDAAGYDPDSARGLTHPRSYGTYPRILGRYVREQRVLSLEEAVRKMSSAVATRLSIHDRGLIADGMMADVAVWDPATIIDRATFTQPHQIADGMKHVFVNGVQVLDNGRHTGAKPGRVLRGPGYRPQ